HMGHIVFYGHHFHGNGQTHIFSPEFLLLQYCPAKPHFPTWTLQDVKTITNQPVSKGQQRKRLDPENYFAFFKLQC
ncbi:hypothetical protein, partial [Desulfonatronospira sp. MSAO_Bac3]|uniref:hypothetical protein n=1 Tax=Desulfonatronospira sp. MSAO_Bac3 TaxID=2293857 RepID=UPI00257BA12C